MVGVMLSAQAFAAESTAPAIDGVWLDQDGAGYIRIQQEGDHWQGRIAGSVAGPVEQDRHNPDPAKRDESLLGRRILIDLACDPERCSGKLYNPRDGRMYSARLQMADVDTLELRGYLGTPLLGQTQLWSRVTDPEALGLVPVAGP